MTVSIVLIGLVGILIFAVGAAQIQVKSKTRYLVTSANTTEELKAALNKISKQTEQTDTLIKGLVDHNIDGIWDWDIVNGTEYFSPRFKEILGFEGDEFPHVPKSWMDRIHPGDLQMALDEYEKHVATKGEHPYKMVVRYNHKKGHEIKVICRGAVVSWDNEGQPLRMVGTHTDITELL